MAFQAQKWGWRTIATRLFLAPLAVGGLAVTTIAQTGQPPVSVSAGQAAANAAPGNSHVITDPKELLKLGRKALASGQFDTARDLARQAEANNPGGRWGITSDTPESLLRDTMSARARANRSEADRLVRQAKDLAGRPAKSSAEKLENLDQASVMIDRACTLVSGTSRLIDMIPFSEKPEDVKREIDAARGRVRKTLGNTAATASNVKVSGSSIKAEPKLDVASSGLTTNSVRNPAADTTANTQKSDAKTTHSTNPLPLEQTRSAPAGKSDLAQRTMAEAKELMAKGKYAEARIKFMEADKLGGNFPADDNPGRGMLDATVKGKEQINAIVNNAQGHIDRQEWTRAIACMNEARNLTAKLDLRTAPLEEDLEQLVVHARSLGISDAAILAVSNQEVITKVKATEVASAGPASSPNASAHETNLGKSEKPTVTEPGKPITTEATANTKNEPTKLEATAVAKAEPARVTEPEGHFRLPPLTGTSKSVDPIFAPLVEEPKTAPKNKPAYDTTNAKKPEPTHIEVASNHKPGELKPGPSSESETVVEMKLTPPKDDTPEVKLAGKSEPVIDTKPVPRAQPVEIKSSPKNDTLAAMPIPEPPVLPLPQDTSESTLPKVAPAAKPKTNDAGTILVREAQRSIDKGELDHARDLANKAYNGGYGDPIKQEALQLIRGIEVQEILLKKAAAAESLRSALEDYSYKQYDAASRLLSRIDAGLLTEKDQELLEKLTSDVATALATAKQPKPVAPVLTPEPALSNTPGNLPQPPAVSSKLPPDTLGIPTAPELPSVTEVTPPTDLARAIPTPPIVKPTVLGPPSDMPTVPSTTPPVSTDPSNPLAKLTPAPKPLTSDPVESAPPTLPSISEVTPPSKETQGPLPTDPPLVQSTPAPSPAKPPVKLNDQVSAMAEVEFQQLRDEGLRLETQAKQAFDRGDTDVAINMLSEFSAKVKASKLSAGKQSLIATPVDRRLETMRIMKRQTDFLAQESRTKKEQVETRLAKSSAEQQKQQEIALRVRQVNELLKSHKYKEAEKLALQAKTLDPDDVTLRLVYELAKRNRIQDEAVKRKEQHAEMVLGGLGDAEDQGPLVTSKDPVALEIDRVRRARLRGSADNEYVKNRTPIEREIELKLEKPMTLEFQNAPIRDVINEFRQKGDINILVDDFALSAEGLEIDKMVITEKLTSPISLRSIMTLMFAKHGLQPIVENDVVHITTLKKAKGRLYTKVFSVMDLVTPIPDFALPEHAVFSKQVEANANALQRQPWQNMATSSGRGLADGQLVGQAPGPNGVPIGAGNGGRLDNTSSPGSPQNHPLSASAHLAPTKSNASQQLMKLITGMVRPYSWKETGGPGQIDYYDIGGALVVNQTADVIKEVTDLLESLRRLQDLSIAVEIRVVSLTEDFYERVGVDFAMNVKTNNNLDFERQLTTGQFRPQPFLNSINTTGVVSGYNPAAGGFTSDLKLPIRPNTYGFSVPPFGNYPGNGNGGLNLGLAFLNDIQVYLFMEAAAGNRRINVMQAPKITLFNGQTSTVSVQDFQYFTTGLQVTNVGGQFVYVPQNQPLPVGGGGGNVGGQPGVTIAVQGVVSSDRRFVRMTLTPSFTVLSSATVPLFPITAFITPVFEGGSQGTPIPFTQFFQQPAFQTISVQTTVAVPDGGTVLMGGLKTMSEGRNEYGPPVVSNVPYLNRLFKNTAIGRETRHIMLMVTPRIIINLEEQFNQTGVEG